MVLLLGYGFWSARRKKKTAQAKFQDSVLGAAAAGAAPCGMSEPTLGAATPARARSAAVEPAAAGMAAEEVDPIAEADVYMAYGRDAQAEEILKEALQKDSDRIPVHAKLLEIYAKRKDTKAFEQSALKLKNLTNGAGPEWDKAAALGTLHRSAQRPVRRRCVGCRSLPRPPRLRRCRAPRRRSTSTSAARRRASASAPDLTLDVAAEAADAAARLRRQRRRHENADEETRRGSRRPARPRTRRLDFDLDLGAAGDPSRSPATAAAAPAADRAA